MLILFILLVGMLVGAMASSFLVFSITGHIQDFIKPQAIINSIATDKKHLLLFLLLSAGCFVALAYICFFNRTMSPRSIATVRLTPQIEIPKVAGQNQHGSARFTTSEEQSAHFKTQIINSKDPLISALLDGGKQDIEAIKSGEVIDYKAVSKKLINGYKIAGGVPVSYEKLSLNKELIKSIVGDVHTITYGETRCGKTRTLVLQSLCLQGLAGDDMLNIDPKGELYDYMYPFLNRLGYNTRSIDFKMPEKSVHFNFLQFIIDALNNKNISKAIQYSWDFVDCVVPDGGRTAEPIWSNGEKSLLAAAVIQVVYDNCPMGLCFQYPNASDEEIAELYETKHKWFQNCTNLYNFVSQMAQPNPVTKNMLLTDIISVLPDSHPSKLIMKVTESAPDKMQGSFITSALTTLRLFTDPNISEMSSYTDDGFLDPQMKKSIFIIVPDTKKTYYPLVGLFVNQYYQYLADIADGRGGRLIRKIHFNLDEFGNCEKFPNFDGKLTVGAGRGILFNIYLQSKDQLVEKYGKDLAGIILDNCHYMIYLKSGTDTAKMIEEKLGKYTIQTTSSSASLNDSGGLSTSINSGSSSSSTQLMGRSLLTSDEIRKIVRPYLLVLSDDGFPSLTQSPDLHKWFFNQMLGLGNEEHNCKVRIFRESIRPLHEIAQMRLWNFIPYINRLLQENADDSDSQDVPETGESEADFLAAIDQNFSY